jgi:hypothetical protein
MPPVAKYTDDLGSQGVIEQSEHLLPVSRVSGRNCTIFNVQARLST